MMWYNLGYSYTKGVPHYGYVTSGEANSNEKEVLMMMTSASEATATTMLIEPNKPSFWYLPFRSHYWNVFVLGFLLAFLMFIPFVIKDQGFFFYYGDFNVQQIPFYRHAHQMVREGNIFWDWGTDLGSNFIGSYAFYLLTSPFFWLTLPFPNEMVPHLMAPLLMLKFACAGVTAFAFIKRFTYREHFAVLGALLYAFCGFNQYNIFFNHFHEAVIIFPLVLVALEEAVQHKRRGVFALAVFGSVFINYFFFAGQVVFILIYFMIRCLSPSFRITLRDFGLLFFEAVLGVMLAALVLLPAVMAVMANPRTQSVYYGMDMIIYGNVQRYFHIIQSLFFPPDIPARPNFFPDSNAKWASISLYLPLFTMAGVVTFFKHTKRHWVKPMLIISLIMALVPLLNSMFFALNFSYYARWFYMPILVMAVATTIALENHTYRFGSGIKFCVIAVASFSIIGIIPKTDDEGILRWFTLPPHPERLWAYVGIAVISFVLLWVLFRLPRYSRGFFHAATLFTCVISLISTMTVMAFGRTLTVDNPQQVIVEQGLRGKDNFNFAEDVFFRLDTNGLEDNMPMFWDLPTIQCFHSVVTPSIMDFYQSIGVPRDVASRPESNRYALRGLTSVKYLVEKIKTGDEIQSPSVVGFEPIGEQNGFYVSENRFFIPMGFTYDHAIQQSAFDGYEEEQRELIMLHAIVLSAEDMAKYQHLFAQAEYDRTTFFTQENYFRNAEARAASAGESFSYDTKGFTSKIVTEKETLAFYSVPYEAGWRATVNGEPAEVVCANQGFMAVLVPAGENVVTFSYEVPGLFWGILLSGLAVVVLLGYLLMVRMSRHKHPLTITSSRDQDVILPPAELPEQTTPTDSDEAMGEEETRTPPADVPQAAEPNSPTDAEEEADRIDADQTPRFSGSTDDPSSTESAEEPASL